MAATIDSPRPLRNQCAARPEGSSIHGFYGGDAGKSYKTSTALATQGEEYSPRQVAEEEIARYFPAEALEVDEEGFVEIVEEPPPVRRRISCKSKDPAFKVTGKVLKAGARKPRKPRKFCCGNEKHQKNAGWPGTRSQPCSVYWQCAVQHAQLHVPGGFDLNKIQDLLLPVKEVTNDSNVRILLFRIFGAVPLQVTLKKFRGTNNARHAITVLQFCQAAGLTKEQLEEVKSRLHAEIVNEAGESRIPWPAD